MSHSQCLCSWITELLSNEPYQDGATGQHVGLSTNIGACRGRGYALVQMSSLTALDVLLHRFHFQRRMMSLGRVFAEQTEFGHLRR